MEKLPDQAALELIAIAGDHVASSTMSFINAKTNHGESAAELHAALIFAMNKEIATLGAFLCKRRGMAPVGWVNWQAKTMQRNMDQALTDMRPSEPWAKDGVEKDG